VADPGTAPKLVSELTFTVPAFTAVAPLYVVEPLRTSVPEPLYPR
jgi:hypothetical protein